MFTPNNAAKHGSKGGRQTVNKHGREHMSQIGRKGFEATTERHFNGDPNKHKSWLAELCRWNYFAATGLPMKHDRDGRAIWPSRKPRHPADSSGIPF
jgi:general stress protein YciG